MINNLSQAANRLVGQPMFALLERVKNLEARGEKIIHFEIGDPDFTSPLVAKKACINAIMDDETHYSASSGIKELKRSVASYTLNNYNFAPSLDNVVISSGCNPLIYCIIKCLCNDDNEIIIQDPCFPTYTSVLNLLNLKYRTIDLKEENKFKTKLSDIAPLITVKTKLIILNSPHNPTGSVIDDLEMIEIEKFCIEKNIFLLRDEVYNLINNGRIIRVPQDNCCKNIIMIDSLSKSYSMTGWRLGWMVGPDWLCEKISLLLQTIISCTNTFVQKAACSVLNEYPMGIINNLRQLNKKKLLIFSLIKQINGLDCVMPTGAFYIFINIKNFNMTSQTFADFILDKAKVAILPGSDFGKMGEGYIRIAYCTSDDNIREGITRIKKALNHVR